MKKEQRVKNPEGDRLFDDKGNMIPQTVDINATLFDLRQQVAYWQSMHTRAVERESVWKAKAQEFEAIVRRQEVQLKIQAEQIEALKARMCLLQQQVFGQKSEQSDAPNSVDPSAPVTDQDGAASSCTGDAPRKRGKQEGAEGHGRKRREGLPKEEVIHALPESACCCPDCGAPLAEFPGSEDSEEIHWDVRLIRRVHKRKRYRPTCTCGVLPKIITSPPAAKLISFAER